MYSAEALRRLQENAAYERWALMFLAHKQAQIEEGPGIPVRVTFHGASKPPSSSINVGDFVGESLEVVDALAPLRLTAGFKLLDLVIEWILEENGLRIWKFSKKVEQVSRTPPNVPSLFQNHPFIWEYAFAMYKHLVPFRNEIVHSSNFSVQGDRLEVTRDKKTLRLDRRQLLALGRVSTTVLDLLVERASWSDEIDARLKYELDRITSLHGQEEFGVSEPMPVVLEFVFDTIEEAEVDLKGAREEASRLYEERHHLFRAEVKVRRPTPRRWVFPSEVASLHDSIRLSDGAFSQYLVSSST